jgi:hypothetical protein
MMINDDEHSDTIAHIQIAIVLLLICATYACAVQYSLVSDIILLRAARRVPTLFTQTSLQRNLGEEATAPYLLPLQHK